MKLQKFTSKIQISDFDCSGIVLYFLINIQKLGVCSLKLHPTCWTRENIATYSSLCLLAHYRFIKGSGKNLMLTGIILFPKKYDHNSKALEYDAWQASARISLNVSSFIFSMKKLNLIGNTYYLLLPIPEITV